MEIKVCRSTDWTSRDWDTYRLGFNEVFHKDFSQDYFKSKYLSVYKGYAFHALLLSDEGNVAGGVTVIPCYYKHNGERFLNGLAVDVFIREAYRTDPLMLRRMYKRLRSRLEEEEVVAVIAVPNATAYPYWKNVVKWQDVGRMGYWALPVRLGNVLGKSGMIGKLLNAASLFYGWMACAVYSLSSFVCGKSPEYAYTICKDDPYFSHKFDGPAYRRRSEGRFSCLYKIEDEEGVRTGYLLRAEENGSRSARALHKAVSTILSERVDIVLYVGKMGFFQTLLLRVPRRFEPKRLPMTCDLIGDRERYSDMLDYSQWDFSLQNYDVR